MSVDIFLTPYIKEIVFFFFLNFELFIANTMDPALQIKMSTFFSYFPQILFKKQNVTDS